MNDITIFMAAAMFLIVAITVAACIIWVIEFVNAVVGFFTLPDHLDKFRKED